MLQQIKFNSIQFDSVDSELLQLTNNTIILCSDALTKRIIANEIMKSFDDENYEGCDYYYDDDDTYNIEVQYLPTTILKVQNSNIHIKSNKNNCIIYATSNNIQHIIITTECPFVLQCQSQNDLYFAESDNDDKIHLYHFTDFKGHEETYNKGLYYLYKEVLSGVYGGFKYES